ncbi:protein phosphatase CheZ [bacterium]|nr:protein phosphatase CheZ [bacterium]
MKSAQFNAKLQELIDCFPKDSDTKIVNKVVKQLRSLVQSIENHDSSEVSQFLDDLETKPGDFLFTEIGQLLRRFHNQLVLIRDGIPENLGKIASQDVVEISEKLQMIVTMTDKAANTTLDLTEEIIDNLEDRQKTCEEIKKNLTSMLDGNKLSPQAKKKIIKTIQQTEKLLDAHNPIQEKLTNILIAQDYQDLTGQIIFKVITLLKEIETDLAQLIKKFGQTIVIAKDEGQMSLKGPLSDSDSEKSSQDDVDNLLSQFGF